MRGASVTFYLLWLGLAATASPLNPIEWFQRTKHENRTSERDSPNRRNGYFSLLCWVEKTVTTESKHTGEGRQHKEFSIIMESPGKLTTEDICSNINLNEMRNITNSTSVKEHGDTIITDTRLVFCGLGPTLSEQYLELPQADKKIMEVKINNGLPVSWGMCERNDSDTVGSVRTSTTFDTTRTPETTKRTTEIDYHGFSPTKPHLGIKRNTPSSKPSYEVNENVEDIPRPIEFPQVNQENHNDLQNCSDDTAEETDDHQSKAYNLLLSRNINFVSLNDFKAMKNPFENSKLLINMRKQKGPVLFNLLFPRESIFENHRRNNEKRVFVVKIKITLSCQELMNDETISHKAEGSKMEIEEDNLFIILPSS